MKTTSLKRRALITFLISSIAFIIMIVVASRFYIQTVANSYSDEHETNNAYIGYEFSKIIRFYAETDPEKLIDSELLKLYAHLEDETYLTVMQDGQIIFGASFYQNNVLADSDTPVETYTCQAGDVAITLFYKSPINEPEKPDPAPFTRVDEYATLAFALYLILVLLMFTWFINRLLKPLEEVKRAAREIQSGNLEFQITYTGDDEIGQVYQAIEEMRTALKSSEDMRTQYERNRNELLSNITHDLKTPITSIKGYVDGILDGVASTPDKLQRYARTIQKHTLDMDALINDLFLMSKLDVDQIDFKYEPLEMDAFLRDCYDDYAFDLTSKGISFSYQSDLDQKVYAYGDRQNLKRVMINLLQNSIKYIDPLDGDIQIKLSLADTGHIKVVIRDNGKGIPQEDLANIFDRFYRVDDARNSNMGGSGIGLSIVKKILEKHDGTITAHSQLGVYTQMTITLPIYKETRLWNTSSLLKTK